jgi:hypothetical protein
VTHTRNKEDGLENVSLSVEKKEISIERRVHD